MAYKQNPGRGNSPKTGHGIPTPLMQTTAKKLSNLEDESSKAVGKYK